MNKFYVAELTFDSIFNVLLILTNSDAPLTPISEIEKAVLEMDNGRILIDQILHSGNTGERFISLDIIEGKVDQTTISYYAVPKGEGIRDISRRMLCNYNLIEFSILSSVQKKMLLRGISI